MSAFLRDLLFPKLCFGCGMIGCYICLRCQQKLIFIEKDSCFYCQKKSFYGITHPGCRTNNGVDGSISIFYYNNLLKSVIKSFKYRKALTVWKDFCLLIKPDKLAKLRFYSKIVSKKNNRSLVIQPIPLYRKKQQERGFNQAEIISKYFQQYLDLPIVDHLIRIKETKPQSQIKEIKNKSINIKGAFIIKKTEKNNYNYNYILVDDLLTSGSTAKEATKILKTAGANKVFILTLARG